ncbi:MAG: hypothetical protein MI923_13320, partial [Phycisphaerales bacterium]|nr:hypothetical protein [Phycisphaerales bacterium]
MVNKMKKLDYPIESEYSISELPADSPAARRKLEAAFSHHKDTLDTAKWPRAAGWFTNSCFVLGNQYSRFTTTDQGISAHSAEVVPQTQVQQYIPAMPDNQILRPY